MINLTAAQQALVKSDSTVKNFHIHFPNGEIEDLDNSNLVFESVSFSESVCSDSVFRFGCADASVLSFETVGVPNMLGMVIECSMEFKNGNDSVTIPYGTFTVDSCPRDHKSMQHRKVTAYAQTVGDTVTEFERYKATVPRLNTDVYTPNVMHMVGAMSDEMLEDMTATVLTLSTASGSGFEAEGITDNNGAKVLRMYDTGGGEQYSLVFGHDPVSQYHSREVDNDAVYKIKLYKGADYDTYLRLVRETVSEYDLTLRPYNDLSHAVITDNHWRGGAGMSVNLAPAHIRYKDKGTWVEVTIYPYLCDTSLGEFLDYMGYLGTYDLKLWDRATDTATTIQANIELYSSIEVTKYVAKTNNLRVSFNSTLQGMYPKRVLSDFYEYPYYTFINAFSIREMVEGFAELNASFGRCNRDGTLSIIRLDDSAPYAITADDVKGRAWWDEYDINPIGSVLFKYTKDNEEMTAKYTFADDPSIYDMTDNKILEKLTATVVEASALTDMTNTAYFYLYDDHLYYYDGTQWVRSVEYDDGGAVYKSLINTLFVPYADTVLFTPLDADLVGMPYLQAGDAITLTAADGTMIHSYILSHTFNGANEMTEDISTVQGEVIA